MGDSVRNTVSPLPMVCAIESDKKRLVAGIPVDTAKRDAMSVSFFI
jgi:hypothetical protein